MSNAMEKPPCGADLANKIKSYGFCDSVESHDGDQKEVQRPPGQELRDFYYGMQKLNLLARTFLC